MFVPVRIQYTRVYVNSSPSLMKRNVLLVTIQLWKLYICFKQFFLYLVNFKESCRFFSFIFYEVNNILISFTCSSSWYLLQPLSTCLYPIMQSIIYYDLCVLSNQIVHRIQINCIMYIIYMYICMYVCNVCMYVMYVCMCVHACLWCICMRSIIRCMI